MRAWLTYVVLVRDIFEALKITLPLHFSDFLFRLVGNAPVPFLVFENVEEPENLVQDEVQAEPSKHSGDATVIRRSLTRLEELRSSNLPNTIAHEDPARGGGALGTTGNVGREKTKNHHETDGVRSQQPNTNESPPFVVGR